MMAEIPKQQIEWIVGELNVGVSDDKVRASIRSRALKARSLPGIVGRWSDSDIQKAEEYAVKVHHDNQQTYNYVMGGSGADWKGSRPKGNPFASWMSRAWYNNGVTAGRSDKFKYVGPHEAWDVTKGKPSGAEKRLFAQESFVQGFRDSHDYGGRSDVKGNPTGRRPILGTLVREARLTASRLDHEPHGSDVSRVVSRVTVGAVSASDRAMLLAVMKAGYKTRRNPTSSQRRSRMQREATQSYAYKAGQSALRAGAARLGTVNLTPSIQDRAEWGHAWKEFMAGWRAEQHRTENPASLLPSTWKPCSVRRLPSGQVQVKIAGTRSRGNPLRFGDKPYDLAPNETGRYHVVDSKGFIRWKSNFGIKAFDHAGNLSDREPGEFRVIDTRDGSEYGAYRGGEAIR